MVIIVFIRSSVYGSNYIQKNRRERTTKRTTKRTIKRSNDRTTVILTRDLRFAAGMTGYAQPAQHLVPTRNDKRGTRCSHRRRGKYHHHQPGLLAGSGAAADRLRESQRQQVQGSPA